MTAAGAIGIIDDRVSARKDLERKFRVLVGGKLQITASPPLPGLGDYPKWIRDNKVSVLVIDQRLHEQADEATAPVEYDGHDVVVSLRKHNRDIPIFVITAHADVEGLKENLGSVEDIITRNDFIAAPEQFVERILRAGLKFRERHQAELSRLSTLASKIASGGASAADQEEAKALQLKLGMSLNLNEYAHKGDWLSAVDAKLKELDRLRLEIDKFLEAQKNK
jgi:CheY-like chemotaxis protein